MIDLLGSLIGPPLSPALSHAIVSDLFRMAGKLPPPDDAFAQHTPQMVLCAHVLIASALRPLTIAALRELPDPAWMRLEDCFKAIEPLTLELVRDNRFRREELVRRWLATWGIPIDGETATVSQQRLDALDYRRTQREYAVAEQARREEAEQRRQQLEARRRVEAESRGWRE